LVSNLEHRLTGGNVADRVVRVGDTIRKPATQATSSVEAFLNHLHAVGFTAAPRSLGRDEQGRHILEYIPGSTVDMSRPLSLSELHRIGRLIQELHTAARSFVPPVSAHWNIAIKPVASKRVASKPAASKPNAESLICHHDLAPWNLVRDGDRWVFIDWDGSGPGYPLWDLAYAAQSFPPLIAKGDPAEDAIRLRSLIDGYGLNQMEREELPPVLLERTRAMYQLLLNASSPGQQPWARLYADGHGEHWKQAATYIEKNLNRWRQALLDKPQR
jgi:Ser/Thr protein kinase RdoA (MazF antagonist)